MTNEKPIIIVGAGVVGLVLAQALKKEGIPFVVYERDAHFNARGHGWGMTLWCLDALDACLPASLLSRLPEAEVDPLAARSHGACKYQYFNLETSEVAVSVDLFNQRRIIRGNFRKLLLEGIDVQWGKSIASFSTKDGGVTVTFEDGSTVEGSLIVGADGAMSKTRQLLLPGNAQTKRLPIRFMGTTVPLTKEEIAPLRAIDPLLFQGTHPKTGSFLWYALLNTPENNGSADTDKPYYSAQLNISWQYRDASDEIPATNPDRIAKIKKLAEPFHDKFRQAVIDLPDDAEVIEIKLREWPCHEWANHGGRVTLIGDAAHAMTMYRGEAANHAITDAKHLRDALVKVWKSKGWLADYLQSQAIDEYEAEMRDRARWSVIKSSQACIDAHDWAVATGGKSAMWERRAGLVTGNRS